MNRLIDALENLLFGQRKLFIALFALMTVFMAWQATHLRIDAGFEKQLPMQHEYMQVFEQYKREFGGANRVLIALSADNGDIFTPAFFDRLKAVTDAVFFLPGVDRARVSSLFTPDVRFTEVVEDGIAGGNVVPSDFANSERDLQRVRDNLLKSNYVGRLVANDFSAALVSAQLLEFDPNTGEKLDFIGVAAKLEDIRSQFSVDGVQIHIIGFAKVVGDIADGASRVVLFFLVAIAITAVLVRLYSQSWRLAVVPLSCSLVAVIWQLGLLPLLGYGIDPMAILVPFLVFAIGVSHGVQMVSAVGAEVFDGASIESAARASFRRLLLPGFIALSSDTIGFVTIGTIEIDVIRHLAVTASLGVAVIILTNLFLLPLLISLTRPDEGYRQRLQQRADGLLPFWQKVSIVATPRGALPILLLGAIALAIGAWRASDVRIGDLHAGVPELRQDSRYNQDTAVITEKFSIGVDLLQIIAEVPPEGCINWSLMSAIDRFSWELENLPGVQSVIALPGIAKRINAGWNEGNPKWRVLLHNPQNLAQAVAYTPTSSGLLNKDCSAIPLLVFTDDHRAETIARIVDAVKNYRESHADKGVRYQLATGNLGVMAATNEEVDAAQYPILALVFAAIIALCLITFRSVAATLCIVLPLALVSLLAYALMAWLQIGLKVNTLPVAALGVGIGVDYGIYIFSRLREYLRAGWPLREAYAQTLSVTGSGVIFTGLTLAIGVATWIFSPLKFQADMGVLLTFMFLVNMLGAILLLPALARFLLRDVEK
jgi:hypothetical protein